MFRSQRDADHGDRQAGGVITEAAFIAAHGGDFGLFKTLDENGDGQVAREGDRSRTAHGTVLSYCVNHRASHD